MPVVARCIQTLSGIVAVSQYPLIVLAICCSWHGFVHTQEANATAVSDETAPPEVAAQVPAGADPPAPENPNQDCMPKIIDQQALTRKIRDINNPLARLPEAEYQKLRRPVATGIQSGAESAADLEACIETTTVSGD